MRTRAFAAVAITASAGLASWQLAEGAPAPPTHERSVTDDYVIGEELGSGSFAQVFSGRCRSTGKLVAIKVVHKSRQSAASIRHELATLQRVSLHKCVASLEAYYESDDCFHIVMELVSGGELFERLVEYARPPLATSLGPPNPSLSRTHRQRDTHTQREREKT